MFDGSIMFDGMMDDLPEDKPTDVPESTKWLCNSRRSSDDSRSCFKPAVTCIRGLNFCALHGKGALLREIARITPAASPVAPSESAGYEPEKRCCTVCDAKKLCHVCGQPTLYACSDCRIDFGVSIYVCPTKECRMAHEAKCSAVLIARANPSAEGDGR